MLHCNNVIGLMLDEHLAFVNKAIFATASSALVYELT